MNPEELGKFFASLSKETEVLIRVGQTEFVLTAAMAVFDPQENLLTLHLEEYVEEEEAESSV